jgi:para-aminobenzoate synthetase
MDKPLLTIFLAYPKSIGVMYVLFMKRSRSFGLYIPKEISSMNVIPTPLIPPETKRQQVMSAILEEFEGFATPEKVFELLFSKAEYSFWLDSAKETQGSRFSFMGGGEFGPEGYRISYSLKDRKIQKLKDGIEHVTELPNSDTFFRYIANIMHHCTVSKENIDFINARGQNNELPFFGGLVGYVGYEMKAESLKLSEHQRKFNIESSENLPDSCFLFADRLLAFDHQLRKVYAIGLFDELNNKSQNRKIQQTWINNTKAAILKLLDSESNPKLSEAESQSLDLNPSQLKLLHNQEQYLSMIEESQNKIVNGETYEVCLTTRYGAILKKPHPSPFKMYQHLRNRNAAPYASFLSLGSEIAIASSSPERFLKVDSGKVITMKPIKGTLKVANSENFNGNQFEIEAENFRRVQELENSEKDRSENLMAIA